MTLTANSLAYRRALELGMTTAQAAALTPTSIIAIAELPTAAEAAKLAYALDLQIEGLRLHNLCERQQLAALQVDTSSVPVAVLGQ